MVIPVTTRKKMGIIMFNVGRVVGSKQYHHLCGCWHVSKGIDVPNNGIG